MLVRNILAIFSQKYTLNISIPKEGQIECFVKILLNNLIRFYCFKTSYTFVLYLIKNNIN
jgi:hypothetical protein